MLCMLFRVESNLQNDKTKKRCRKKCDNRVIL